MLPQLNSLSSVVSFVLILCSCQASEPIWPTFSFDLQRTGQSTAPAINSPRLRCAYKTPEADEKIYSSAAIGSDGTIYFASIETVVPSRGYVYAIDSKDCSERWRFDAGDWVEASITLNANDDVLVGTAFGDFYSIASDGTLNWKHEGAASDEGFYPDSIMSSALLIEDVIVVGSRDEHLYFFNASTGGVIRRILLQGDVHSSPALSRDGALVYAMHADAARPNASVTTSSTEAGNPPVVILERK